MEHVFYRVGPLLGGRIEGHTPKGSPRQRLLFFVVLHSFAAAAGRKQEDCAEFTASVQIAQTQTKLQILCATSACEPCPATRC